MPPAEPTGKGEASQELRAIRRAILDLDEFEARPPADITNGDGNPSPTTVVDAP
jgi:hypothetical protein